MNLGLPAVRKENIVEVSRMGISVLKAVILDYEECTVHLLDLQTDQDAEEQINQYCDENKINLDDMYFMTGERIFVKGVI